MTENPGSFCGICKAQSYISWCSHCCCYYFGFRSYVPAAAFPSETVTAADTVAVAVAATKVTAAAAVIASAVLQSGRRSVKMEMYPHWLALDNISQ